VSRPADVPSRHPAPQPWPGVALRLLLGASIAGGIGLWAWRAVGEGPAGIAAGVLATTVAALAWWLPFTPGDTVHPRGLAPVGGRVRLALDAGLLLLAAVAIWTGLNRAVSETLLTAALIHAALTTDRLRWLFRDHATKPPALG
jgi:hypothetical protein